MSKEISQRDRIHCYLTWFIYMFFSMFMLVTSLVSHWPVWVNYYVAGMMMIVTSFTMSKRVSVKVQSYVFVLASVMNIFGYSVLDDNFYASIVVLCCLATLTAIYMDVKLIFVLFLWSVWQVIAHVFLFQTLVLETTHDILSLTVRVLAMLFGEAFLVYFVNRQCLIEDNLKASVEEARKAERSKSDFLANMSHEIRTPMNAIIGMCELVLREDINEEVRENCVNIQHSGRSLLAIINDILDFSKLNSGKTQLVEESFNIGSVVNDVMNMAATRKGDKKIELIARIDPELPKGLVGDEGRIRQIIINLMTNAIKFTNEGCVVLKMTQSRHEYGINLNVTIEDTGIGITEENQEKLFTTFQQVDTRKNRTVEGTGLGLAICKQLIAQMGGFINVSSVYGEGSTFRFVIPLKVSDPEPFISIRDAYERSVAIYVDMKKFKYLKIAKEYLKLIREMGEKFHTRIQVLDSVDALETAINNKEFEYCFTAREEYCENEELFIALAKKAKVFVVQDRSGAISLPKEIRMIYKPFYALSVAAALNNEKYIFNLNERKTIARFEAPEAQILIVDDNITNLKVAEGLMRPYKMKIFTALSGREALDLIQKNEFDLVFMDHMMPELDGVETTELIRQMEGESYKKLPVIALTANAVNGAREMFLTSGFNDFIAKPIELSVLDRVLRAWLKPERILSATQVLEWEDEEPTRASEGFREVIQEETGLVYAGGNSEVYHENLKVYWKNGEEHKQTLERCFTQDDRKQYVIEVHALKSSSLSIGAVELSELAKTLEFAGKADDYETIRKKHNGMIRLYERVLFEIEEFLKEKGGAPAEPASQVPDVDTLTELQEEKLTEYVEQICTACDNFDGEGVVLIVNLLSVYRYKEKVLQNYFSEVKRLAEDFDYEGARKTAEELFVGLKEE